MKITIEYKLYTLRIAKGLTVRQLARQSGVSKSMINNIENNNGNPTVMVICKLAEALKVKPNELFSYSVE